MKTHLYLSLIPESLIVSMVPPEEFGSYFAVGTQQLSRGQAVFFEIDPDFECGFFPLAEAKKRCVAHKDGSPRRSVYAGIYRVLENVPLSALGKLYLVTDDGKCLPLESRPLTPDTEKRLHLYQEICPVTPAVGSSLNPVEFCRYMTESGQPVSVPRLAFCELKLGELAHDPDKGGAEDLPYLHIDHLRDCLREVRDHQRETKNVVRNLGDGVNFRMVRNGFFVGDQENVLSYPMPPAEELEKTHYGWWRSATEPQP